MPNNPPSEAAMKEAWGICTTTFKCLGDRQEAIARALDTYGDKRYAQGLADAAKVCRDKAGVVKEGASTEIEAFVMVAFDAAATAIDALIPQPPSNAGESVSVRPGGVGEGD